MKKLIRSLMFICALFSAHLYSQSTEFTYQGKLNTAGVPANGNHDFTFILFEGSSGGVPVSGLLQFNSVQVTDGVFSVNLDFGSTSFPAASRFLEIGVRPSGTGAFTPLAPRQPITSAPYSITARNLGGQPASFYTNASNLSSGTIPTARLGNGSILNQSNQQANTNFNISGSGNVGGTLSGAVVNAGQQFSIGGQRILFGDASNTIAGQTAGSANTGSSNSFFGAAAGLSNTLGLGNSFIGTAAGRDNTTGAENSFVGFESGRGTTFGSRNTFIGRLAGRFNTTGNDNTFVGFNAGAANGTAEFNTAFGSQAGQNNVGAQNSFFGGNAGTANVNGFGNSFFGRFAGIANTEGDENSFFGRGAGQGNTLGNRNTMLGANADVGSNSLSNATAIGARAFVTQQNSIVLGSINGINGATTNTFVGVGTTAPAAKLAIAGNGAISSSSAARVDLLNTANNRGYRLFVNDAGDWEMSNDLGVVHMRIPRATGAALSELQISGALRLGALQEAGDQDVCLRTFNFALAQCASAARDMTNVRTFTSGLEILKGLRPVIFNWKESGALDLGLVAEEVAQVERLLATYNSNGGVNGVKHSRVGVILVNAVKEQQVEIETQKKLIEAQQKQIDALKALLCAANASAAICRE